MELCNKNVDAVEREQFIWLFRIVFLLYGWKTMLWHFVFDLGKPKDSSGTRKLANCSSGEEKLKCDIERVSVVHPAKVRAI